MSNSDDIELLLMRLKGCAADYNLDPSDTAGVDELTNSAADEIERLRATIRGLAAGDWEDELEDSYDARHEDSAGDDDSGGDAGTDGRDVGDGVPVPGGVRADRVREGLPDRYPWGDLDADWDPDTYADHHANHYIDPNADPDPYGDTA